MYIVKEFYEAYKDLSLVQLPMKSGILPVKGLSDAHLKFNKLINLGGTIFMPERNKMSYVKNFAYRVCILRSLANV